MDILKRIAGGLVPYRRNIILGMVLLVTGIATRMVAPLISKSVVNDVIHGGNVGILWRLCAALILLTALRAACVYARGLIFERISQNYIFDMRTELYKHLHKMSYGFYDKNRIGEIMSRLTGDIEGVRNMIINTLVSLTENALFFIVSIIMMSTLSWKLTIMVLIVSPLLSIIAWKFNKVIRPAHAAVREQNAVMNTVTQENISGVRVVKAFAREEYEKDQFAKENNKLLNAHLHTIKTWSDYFPILETVGSLSLPIVLVYGAYMIFAHQMDIGTLVAFTGYIWMVTNPMRMVANFINMFAQGITSAEKLYYYKDLGANIKSPEQPVEPEARRGDVKFENVSFSYGSHMVLKNITFDAPAGTTTAIMGATGTGKTSVVNLLGRFYDIRSGSVIVDGVDVRQQDLHALRSTIGYVMQESFLYSDSVEDNIAFGIPDAPHEDVASAAKIAQADEFINDMPEGYKTVVGERGLGLSGGQKQRVAIARAILYDPKILVLDDSTSAVDMETEFEIQKGLETVMNGRTTFIIAHRISSVKNADQILVLSGGEIAERGKHDELLEKKGLYYDMYMDQYRDFEQIEIAVGSAAEVIKAGGN